MKIYSIGRDTECDIVVNDSSDVISRRHALVNVANNGKITITDTSYNGTYVNGIRISPNVAVPVTRKDSVTFAHMAKLDWKAIPQPPLIRWGLPVLVVLVALIVAVICLAMCGGEKEKTPAPTPVVVKDSTNATTNGKVNQAVSDKNDKAKSATKQKVEPKTEQKAKPQPQPKVKEKYKKTTEDKTETKVKSNKADKGNNTPKIENNTPTSNPPVPQEEQKRLCM